MADKQTVKVGDKVKSLVTQLDVREGATYEVKGVNFDGDIWVTDDVGDRFYLTTDEFVLLPVADATGKPALTIETGKFYRTRNGRKVGPATARTGDLCGDGPWRLDGWNYDIDGICSNLGGHNPKDLIAEWVDEPASNDNQPVALQPAGTADPTVTIGSDTTELEVSLDRVIAKLERIKALKAAIAA